MNSYGDGNTYRGTVCKDSETPTIITDGKTAYSGKDYPVHSSGPWSVSAGIAPDPKGRLIVEDCHGNPVCATSARGVQGRVPIMEANAKLIAAAPELYEALEEALLLVDMSTSYRRVDIAQQARKALAKARGEYE
jgi:hypothetical protein